MLTIKIRDFRGCEAADLECAPICLVAGNNAAGKSSIAQAVGAALTGHGIMVEGVAKGSAGTLVHTGAADAIVEVAGDTGTAKMAWPMCQGATAGDAPPHASVYAVGMANIPSIDRKERARVLAEYLKSDPEYGDLAAALRDVDLGDDKVVSAIWNLITEKGGWDSAHALRKDKGAELKGRWRQVTGANYGSRIAASWHPEGWTDDLDSADEPSLTAAVANAKHRHEAAIGAAAVSEAERETLQREAAAIDERRRAVLNQATACEAIEAEIEKSRKELEALPGAISELGMPCPHCGGSVVLRRVNLAEERLEKAETIPEAELKKRRKARADTSGKLGYLGRQLGEAKRNLTAAEASATAAVNALTRLQEDKKSSAAVDAEAAKTALAAAEIRIRAFRQKLQADDLRDKVASNDLLIEILAPDGLRAKKLGRVLDRFNRDNLLPCCIAAQWKPVTVDADMTIAYGGRPYGLLSQSEQYRVRTVLQIAMARIDGSRMLVLDAAEVLDGPTRSDLLNLLAEAEIPALVCLTLTRREQLPDLRPAGLGQSAWIASGLAEPIDARRNKIEQEKPTDAVLERKGQADLPEIALALSDGSERIFADPQTATEAMDAELRARFYGALIAALRAAGRDDLAERLHATRADLASDRHSGAPISADHSGEKGPSGFQEKGGDAHVLADQPNEPARSWGTSTRAPREEKFWSRKNFDVPGSKPKELLYWLNHYLRQCRDQFDVNAIEMDNASRIFELPPADKIEVTQMILARRTEIESAS